MSGFHTPKWFDFLLSAVDVAHKAVHPSRWGEGKPCECGKRTRWECSILCEKDEHEDGGP